MSVEAARSTDLAQIVALEELGFDPASRWTSRSWADELVGPDRFVVVSRDASGDVEAVATSQCVPPDADLHRVVVHPERRRRGIAAVLVTESLAWATQQGAERMLLEVESDNAAAQGLYTALGFSEISRRRDYYGAGRDALVMERRLEGVA